LLSPPEPVLSKPFFSSLTVVDGLPYLLGTEVLTACLFPKLTLLKLKLDFWEVTVLGSFVIVVLGEDEPNSPLDCVSSGLSAALYADVGTEEDATTADDSLSYAVLNSSKL
jgi:hypothetical protein